MNRRIIFDAVRMMLGRGFTQAEVDALDKAIDLSLGALSGSLAPAPLAPPPQPPSAGGAAARALGAAGTKLIRKWEGCAKRRADGRFDAYPDPGARDGKPWTIGWGSTGADVAKGVVWTQAQCDARFDRDMLTYVDAVDRALAGAPASQNQFDALVSFHYNTGAIARATLTRLHGQGRFEEARAEFGKWIYNDGKAVKGLVSRRADEARLYATP